MLALAQLLPDHEPNDIPRVDFNLAQHGDSLTVPQDGQPVREAVHLFKPVGNIQDADSPLFQRTDGLEQVFGLLHAERSGRLIHDDERRLH